MLTFFSPSSINVYSVSFDYNNELRLRGYGSRSATEFRGKQAVIGLTCPPSQGICPFPDANIVSSISSAKYPFLYISPECNISRDALRNSGFHIVRSKEKANCVIIPRFKESAKYGYNICIVTEEGWTDLYRLEDIDSPDSDLQTRILNFIKEKRYSNKDPKSIHVYYEGSMTYRYMYIVPKCENYSDLWGKGYVNYGMEDNLRFTPSVEVTPELFAIWDKCNDLDIIACALTQCDWQKYPLTLAKYLSTEKPGIRHRANDFQKHILRQIGFYQFWENNTYDKAVEPDDWNMYQKCILARLGLPETGGLIKDKNSDSNAKLGSIPYRIKIKPMYITEAAYYPDLMQAVRNM